MVEIIRARLRQNVHRAFRELRKREERLFAQINIPAVRHSYRAERQRRRYRRRQNAERPLPESGQPQRGERLGDVGSGKAGQNRPFRLVPRECRADNACDLLHFLFKFRAPFRDVLDVIDFYRKSEIIRCHDDSFRFVYVPHYNTGNGKTRRNLFPEIFAILW